MDTNGNKIMMDTTSNALCQLIGKQAIFQVSTSKHFTGKLKEWDEHWLTIEMQNYNGDTYIIILNRINVIYIMPK